MIRDDKVLDSPIIDTFIKVSGVEVSFRAIYDEVNLHCRKRSPWNIVVGKKNIPFWTDGPDRFGFMAFWLSCVCRIYCLKFSPLHSWHRIFPISLSASGSLKLTPFCGLKGDGFPWQKSVGCSKAFLAFRWRSLSCGNPRLERSKTGVAPWRGNFTQESFAITFVLFLLEITKGD